MSITPEQAARKKAVEEQIRVLDQQVKQDTPELAAACRGARFPVIPGVMTPSEVISARNSSFAVLKFYPAQGGGGVSALASFGALFPDVVFCASGGVTNANAADYLALENVASVAGSWMIPPPLLEGL